MTTVKLVFVAIMTVLALIMFITPLIFPERNGSKNTGRIKIIVRVRLGCFLIILVLLLLCLILR